MDGSAVDAGGRLLERERSRGSRRWEAALKYLIPAFMILALAGPDLAGQSLPDLARSERERRRREAETSVRAYTNESVSGTRGQLFVAPTGPEGLETDELEPGEAPAADGPTAGGRTESEWRELFADARAEITRAEERAQLNQQELDELNLRLLTESGLFNREGILLPQIQAKREELEAARVRIETARAALATLTEELRRAGGPPGWSRP